MVNGIRVQLDVMFNGESQGKRQVLSIPCRGLELNFVKRSFYLSQKARLKESS